MAPCAFAVRGMIVKTRLRIYDIELEVRRTRSLKWWGLIKFDDRELRNENERRRMEVKWRKGTERSRERREREKERQHDGRWKGGTQGGSSRL